MGKAPTSQELSKPEDLRGLLREDRGDDCLSCRVIGKWRHKPALGISTDRRLHLLYKGSGAFLGLAAYSYFSGTMQLEKQRDLILRSNSMFGMRSRKLGITGISLGLAWMGLWRLLR